MKRSEINQKIRETEAFIKEHGFHLPPFCNWTPEDWKEKGEECAKKSNILETSNNRAQQVIKDLINNIQKGKGDYEVQFTTAK